MILVANFNFVSSIISIISAKKDLAIIMKSEGIYSFARPALNLLRTTCSHFCIGILLNFLFISLMVTPAQIALIFPPKDLEKYACANFVKKYFPPKNLEKLRCAVFFLI